uniref:ASCH domain-containing protein n=1 Tax=viral metagenome TaxID=1070528 RepID=A0A6C0KVG0_9ZZZZ
MSIKEINVSQPWFDYIKLGKKTIEGRLNKGMFSQLKKDDIIKFVNKDEHVIVRVEKIQYYDSFFQYLTLEGLERTLPDVYTIEEGINIYYKYYTKEQEKEYRILAISIELVDD